MTSSRIILDLEIAALERWNHGDPYGYLELSDEDVVYFDPFLETRLNGKTELKKLYDSLAGKISVREYQLINPVVQGSESMAVLTFNLLSWDANGKCYKWHCTEAYRKTLNGWRIFQTHWSFSK
ncbi:MAG: nuclear transport factor 2 family protein [Ignavibacteria bacterium]|nr:nuclear transport factor 2 family protein [Ignavibacteria bacterium]